MTIEELNSLKETATEQLTADYACYFGIRDAEIILELIDERRDMIPMAFHDKVCELAYRKLMDECEKRRWIPVGERLPDIKKYVICANNSGDAIVGCHYGAENWYDFSGESWPMSFFNYWMPLPEPPEKDEVPT